MGAERRLLVAMAMSDDVRAIVADFLDRLASALERADVPYMVTGSFASSFHGEPRMTQVVDLVIYANVDGVKRLIEALPKDDYYVDLDAAMHAVRAQRQFNVIDMETGWKADLIVRKGRPFSKEEFERRQRVEVQGTWLWMASPEDVAVAKLEWAKRTGSERQLRDAAGNLASKHKTLDESYMHRWVRALGLVERWTAATSE